MRTGGYTVQQALTFEATSVVKQSISLAKRRGHAQVTPLHVASTMLSLSNGILRTACLQSHSHPLQCKALELCFNVELNRLPVVSSRLSVPQSPNPTISNALVAAFKRAQANQRRGSIDNQQQQPLLVVKIELEQLIISILDDPSVSRVMREAGFVSTQVKSNIEQLLSLDHEAPSTTNNLLDTVNIRKTPDSDHVKEEDVASVLEGLIKKRRSIVVVGECLVTLGNVLKEVQDKFEKGVVPNELKEMKIISIPFSFVNHTDNQEVNEKLDLLRRLVRGVHAKGVVLYVGDLNQWMIDYKSDSNIVEHVIKEIGKMVCEINNGENGKCWLLGIATFGTYTRCRSSHHLLENRWGLHPITLPAGSLGLSLSNEREPRNDSRSYTAETETCQPLLDRSEEVQISCCPDFMQRLEHNHQNTLPMGEPCRKRNSICSLIHKESQEKSSNFSSTISSPFSTISTSSYDQQFSNVPTFSPFSNITTPNSHSSSSDIMEIDYYTPRFKQFNSENLHMLCNALEQKVPWQKHVIPEISATILQCRSGMLRRKETTNASDHIITKKKEETWLLFCGEDSQAKERIAMELASVVFGTYSNFISIALASFSPTRANSDEEGFRNKRRRDEQGSSCIRKIAQAISENPHCVIFVEDLVQVDMCSQLQIKRAIERGTISDSLIGEEVDLSDAVIILCTDGFRKNIQLVNLDLNLSFDDEHVSEDHSEGEMGIVESVDGLIVFRKQELHEDLRL